MYIFKPDYYFLRRLRDISLRILFLFKNIRKGAFMTSHKKRNIIFSVLICTGLFLFAVSCVTTNNSGKAIENLDKIYNGPEDADKALAYLDKMGERKIRIPGLFTLFF